MTPRSLLRKQIKTKLMLCKPLFVVHVKVKGLFKVILQYKMKLLSFKSGCGTRIKRFHKCKISSFIADKWGPVVQ